MRPLNRPMFRYGGPIKEGIMTGMQDRPGYSIGSLVTGAGTALMSGLRASPQFLKNVYQGFRGGKYISPFDSGITKTQRFRNLFPTGRFRQTSPTITRSKTPTIDTKGADYSPINIKPGQNLGFGQIIKDPKRIGAAIAENPILALSTPSLATSAVTGGGPIALELGKGVANFLVPGERFDPFKDKMPEKKEGDTTELKRVDTIGAGEGTTGGSVTDDPNKAKQIQEDRIAKTKKRYYELMGIDKMKKDAAYDSLIDASKIVQEEGADLKGAIRSGALQNRIIQAISKNLDKSADIKRQIDAAILKGEIQKDIASADTTDKEYKKARTKQLKQATSATGQIAAIEAEKGTILGSQTAAILRASDIKYDDIIQDKLFNNFVKDNPGADEIDFMQAKGAGLDDGRYVIRGRLVEKKGNEVAFIV